MPVRSDKGAIKNSSSERARVDTYMAIAFDRKVWREKLAKVLNRQAAYTPDFITEPVTPWDEL